jgi:rubrerythrin
MSSTDREKMLETLKEIDKNDIQKCAECGTKLVKQTCMVCPHCGEGSCGG